MKSFELSPFTPQPEYPAVDLTEENANMLAVTLANELQVHGFHSASEAAVPIFRKLHPVVAGRLPNESMDASRAQAMSHGMTVFEAINSAVMSVEPTRVDNAALQISMLSPSIKRYFTDKFAAAEARDQLQEQMPRTTEVVAEASNRFYRGLGDYAVVGASVERDIIMQSLRLSSSQ